MAINPLRLPWPQRGIVAHQRNRETEQLLARAAGRTRSARAELSAAAYDLFLPPQGRLTDQQRALMGDVLSKLVGSIELELRHKISDRIAPAAGESVSSCHQLLEAAGSLGEPGLLRLVVQRSEEHRLSLLAADGPIDVASGPNLLEALARNPDAELARLAVAYVVGEARRRDRFREPLLLRDDLPPAIAYRLHWQVAAALRQRLLAEHVVEASDLDRWLEGAVRQTMADHNHGQGSYARATRLATRLAALGELGDDFISRAVAQGHLALFASGLAVRASVSVEIAWQAINDRGRHSLLVILRAIGASTAAARSIVELLDAGEPLLRPPAAQHALIAGYDALEPAEVERILRRWQLDSEFREAIDDLEIAGVR